MRILYISKYTILPENGAATRQYFISKALSEIGNNEVMLIGSRSTLGKVPAFKGLFNSSSIDRLKTIILNGPAVNAGFNLKRLFSWLIFERNLRRFRYYIKAFKPEVVIVSSLSILTFLTGIFLKRWLKIPLVIEVRDIYPLTLVEVGNYSPSHPAVKLLAKVEKMGYQNADLILSTLPNVPEHIRTVIDKPFKFKWVPMGVEPGYFNKHEHFEHSSFRKENEFWVCYAGTIGVANALDTLFEAASRLETTHPGIRFAVIGDGPLKASYLQRYGTLKNLVFFPAVAKKDLQSYLVQMDLLVNTWLNKPIYRFGISPNKWIDYMFASRPILVAFSGYRCILEEAGCGRFVDAENLDALITGILDFFAMDKSELDAMGARGKRYLLDNLDYRILSNDLYNSLAELTVHKKSLIDE